MLFLLKFGLAFSKRVVNSHFFGVQTGFQFAQDCQFFDHAVKKIEGSVKLNGTPKEQAAFAHASGYVEQSDIVSLPTCNNDNGGTMTSTIQSPVKLPWAGLAI